MNESSVAGTSFNRISQYGAKTTSSLDFMEQLWGSNSFLEFTPGVEKLALSELIPQDLGNKWQRFQIECRLLSNLAELETASTQKFRQKCTCKSYRGNINLHVAIVKRREEDKRQTATLQSNNV